jgi:ribosome-associated heat shock protein Hsp15
MRIDKWLWCVRVFKTRSIATAECKKGRVFVNNLLVKSSKIVVENDLIEVKKPPVNYTFKIIGIPKNRVAAKIVDQYMIDITPSEEIEKLKLMIETKKEFGRRGYGRPTKKDRRDINKFKNT